MDWIKRLFSTDTSELRKENRELRLLLAKALKTSQELSLRQQESLDRVIMSRFDIPVTTSQAFEQSKSAYTIPVEHLSDVMSVEDDREFLERAHA